MGNKIKENYLSWNLNISNINTLKSIEDWAKHLVAFAVLAPSSHNSQPWVFRFKGNQIFVYRNKKKELKIGDPENAFQFISIGCAIQNIKIAADFYQIPLTIKYFPETDNDSLVAVIELQKDFGLCRNIKEHLIFNILNRSTNRAKHKEEPIPEEFLEKIKQYIPYNDLSLSLFFDLNSKKKLGEISANCGSLAMDWEGFLPELSHHIKNNLTVSKTGIPAFGMDIPTPVSFLVPFIIRFVNMDKLNKKTNIELFEKYTNSVGVIYSKDARDNKNLVLAGEFFELIALIAESFGLKTSIWGASTVIPEFALEISNIFTEIKNPMIVFRLGFPKHEQPKSPRFHVEDVFFDLS